MTKAPYIPASLWLAALLLGCGGGSSPGPDVIPPAAVTDLAVTATTDTAITLTWTAPGDDGTRGRAASYDLRYGPSFPGNDWYAATPAPSLPHPGPPGSREEVRVGGLTAHTDYVFALKTADEARNWSPVSNPAPGRTETDTIPPAPVMDLRAEALSHKNVRLRWTAPGDNDGQGTASAYEIRYAPWPLSEERWEEAWVVEDVPVPAPAGTRQQVVVEGLSDRMTYSFALKTRDDGGNLSELSNVASATTPLDTVPPAPVRDLAVVTVSYERVTLSWTAPGDDGDEGRAAAYDLRYAEGPIEEKSWEEAHAVLQEWQPREAGEREEVTVGRLRPGATYTFALKAGDERGNESGISNRVSATLETLSGRTWQVFVDGTGDAPTIQAAIDSAATGDTVRVGPGVYHELIDFLGKDLVVCSVEGPETTVLQGTLTKPYHATVSLKNGESRSAVLEGFTVTTGVPGILLVDSEPTIRNNVITQNHCNFGAGISGGGYSLSPLAPLIENNRILDNTVTRSGAGMFFMGPVVPEIVGNVVQGNRAGFGDGGAMYLQPMYSGTLVRGNVITDNFAADKGGGIFLGLVYPGLSAEIAYNLVARNRSTGRARMGKSGGGIALEAVNAWVHHNTIVANTGEGPGGIYGGGIAMDDGSSPLIERNIIALTTLGAGIRCLSPTTATIRDNLAWDNTGGHGSGTAAGWAQKDGNLIADPLFCNPDAGDFTLSEDSPALSHPAGPPGAFPLPGCSTETLPRPLAQRRPGER